MIEAIKGESAENTPEANFIERIIKIYESLITADQKDLLAVNPQCFLISPNTQTNSALQPELIVYGKFEYMGQLLEEGGIYCVFEPKPKSGEKGVVYFDLHPVLEERTHGSWQEWKISAELSVTKDLLIDGQPSINEFNKRLGRFLAILDAVYMTHQVEITNGNFKVNIQVNGDQARARNIERLIKTYFNCITYKAETSEPLPSLIIRVKNILRRTFGKTE